MTRDYAVVGKVSDLKPSRGRKVKVGEHEVAVWRVGDTIFAVGNVCAHQHFSMMHEGTLEGLTIRCPMHGWQYSLETGESVSGSGRIPVFDVKIEGESVFVSRDPRQ